MLAIVEAADTDDAGVEVEVIVESISALDALVAIVVVVAVLATLLEVRLGPMVVEEVVEEVGSDVPKLICKPKVALRMLSP